MRAQGELLLPLPATAERWREPEWAALVVRSGRALLVGHEGTEQWLDVRAPERMAISEPLDSPLGRSLKEWAHRWRDGAVTVDERLMYATLAADGATLVIANTADDGSPRIERTIPLPGLQVVKLAADRDRVIVLAAKDAAHRSDQLIDVPLDPPAWPPRRLVRRPIRFDDRVLAPAADCDEAEAHNRALRFGTPGPYRTCFGSYHAHPLLASLIDGRLVVAELVDESWPMSHYPDVVLGFETFDLPGDGPPQAIGRTVTNLDEPFHVAVAGSTLFAPLSGQRLAAFMVGADGATTQIGAVEGVGPVTSVAPLAGHPGWVVTSGAIVDARDIEHPRQASVVDGGVSAGRFVLSAADDSFTRITGLVVTDATDPTAPQPVATLKVPADGMAVWAAAHGVAALVGFSEYGWKGLPSTDVLATLDLSDPSALRVLSTVSTEALATSIPIETIDAESQSRMAATPGAPHHPFHVAGAHLSASSAVAAMGGAVWTFDVSAPARPRHVGRLALGAHIAALVPLDDQRFLVQLGIDDDYMEQRFSGDLVLVTLDADRQPREAGRWSLPDARPGAIAVTGSTVLAVTRGLDDGRSAPSPYLAVIDAGDWRQPVITRRWPLPFDVRAVAVDAAADRVYLAAGGEGLGVAALSAVVR